MKNSFKKIADALDVYDAELAAWRIIPDERSRYVDKGYVKYRDYHVLDDRRRIPYDLADTPMTATYERLTLSADTAEEYPRHRAMDKVIEHLLTPHNH